MSEPRKPVPGLRSLIEDAFGLTVDDEMRKRIEARFGTTLDDDPSRWIDVKRALAVASGEDPDADDVVGAVVDRLAAELGDATGPAPAAWTAAERAVFATVRVEEAFEEGGLANVEPAGARPWLDEAVAGYRLLGLDGHAALAERVRVALADGIDEDGQDDLEEDWFGEVGSNEERAAWIRAHPEAFRA
jgi:hypothetical protein